MDELRDFLYSLAERLTKSPLMDGQTGTKKVRSTSDSGLQVTTQVSIDRFASLYPESQIDALLSELEKEYSPDLGVWRDLKFIYFSRFINEGGPWVDEGIPGVKFIYQVGQPIVGQIEQDPLKRSQDTCFQSSGEKSENGEKRSGPPT